MNEKGFTQSVQKLFSCSAIIFVGLAESPETSDSKPSGKPRTFRVINILNKPKAAIPSSFNFKMEVKQVSPFHLPLSVLPGTGLLKSKQSSHNLYV